jgi:hypothetical protein
VGVWVGRIALHCPAVEQEDVDAEWRVLKEYSRRQWDMTPNTTRRTAIGALFQGQSLSLKKCRDCALVSPSSADPFVMEELFCAALAPGRQMVGLNELLRASVAVETPSDFTCDRCKAKGGTMVSTGHPMQCLELELVETPNPPSAMHCNGCEFVRTRNCCSSSADVVCLGAVAVAAYRW